MSSSQASLEYMTVSRGLVIKSCGADDDVVGDGEDDGR
jgi:hypothetical protein